MENISNNSYLALYIRHRSRASSEKSLRATSCFLVSGGLKKLRLVAILRILYRSLLARCRWRRILYCS